MDKISGIVKASPRVMAVDMKEANPVRPGTPGFRRPEGVSSLKEPPNFGNTAAKSAGIQTEMMDWKSKDAMRASVASDLSDRFFLKARPEPAAAAPVPRSNEMSMPVMAMREVGSKPTGFKGDDMGFSARSMAMASPDEAEEPILSQPEGLYPKGSFIDRTA